MQSHWNKIYEKKELETLGWYEEVPEKCLGLLEKCELQKDDLIIDIGSGVSNFIDQAMNKGFKSVALVDVSSNALERKKSLLKEKNISIDTITWIIGDIGQYNVLEGKINQKVKFWHDRAVLHFLREEKQRENYRNNLLANIAEGGYVMIAEFARDGAKKCSGLDLRNYDEQDIQDFLGVEFNLIESFNYTYYQPSGNPRPFVYTLFQKI